MDNDHHDDQALDALFSAAEDARARPSESFMARLAADADAALPIATPPVRSFRPAGFLTGILTASGLSGAAVLGVWLGFVMPDALDSMSLTTDNTIALSTFLPGADLGAAFSE